MCSIEQCKCILFEDFSGYAVGMSWFYLGPAPTFLGTGRGQNSYMHNDGSEPVGSGSKFHGNILVGLPELKSTIMPRGHSSPETIFTGLFRFRTQIYNTGSEPIGSGNKFQGAVQFWVLQIGPVKTSTAGQKKE